MKLNESIFSIQSWSFYDYQFIDFIPNKTLSCPISSNWIHFEEYILTPIALLITLVITIKIHLTEIRFRDYYALFRCYTMSLCLICLFLTTFLFNTHPNKKTCVYEQILIQYSSLIIIISIFLMSLFRMLNNLKRKFRFTLFFYMINLLLQIIITMSWLFIIKRKHINYHRQLCFRRVEIDLCLHSQPPLVLSTLYFPIILIITAFNIYHFTKPFAIAQLLESIISFIGVLMSGTMWYMDLFFSNHPQVPYRYAAYVFLLTFMLPRVWISELERSRITVEEVKPLLHDDVQFHNGNCTIRFPNDNDDDDEIDIPTPHKEYSKNHQQIIRTTDMSPGEIFTSVIDKHSIQSNGYL